MKSPRSGPRPLCALLLAAWLAAISPHPAACDPVSLVLHSAVFDAPRQRMIVFGGFPGAPSPAVFSNTCWVLALGATPQWDSLATVGTRPGPRAGHVAVYDPAGERMLVFGGFDGSNYFSEVWSLSLAGTPTWTLLQPAGTSPSGRLYSSAVLDSARGRVLVFAGRDIAGYRSDVWSLSLVPALRWDPVVTMNQGPAPRASQSAIYDPLADRMVVFGGFPYTSELWFLSLADNSWSLYQPAGPVPLQRQAHAAIFDPFGDRMVVFGGQSNNSLNDTWAFSLAPPLGWSPVTVAGTPPSNRAYLAAICDPVHRRMVVFGGQTDVVDPTWTLSLNSSPRWSPYSPVARVSSGLLSFPPITRGDIVSMPLSITNGGLQQLQVSEIRGPATQISVDTTAPFSLSWNDSVAVTVALVANRIGHVQDSLVIVSNDPVTPREQVLLDVEVHEFEFDTRPIGIPAQAPAPLGIALNVVVTPRTGTRIESGALYYRTRGSAHFDSLSLTPLAADFIATIPAAAVTERGLEYFVRVEHNGFSATQPAGAPDTSFAQPVAAPSAMTAIPQPTSGTDFLAGREITVEAVLPLGATFVSGRIHYRQGGETSFAIDSLKSSGARDRPFVTLPASVAGPRGIEYWLEVQTLASSLRYPAVAAVDVIPVKVQDLVEPVEHPGSRYRLLSIPLSFGADFSSGLDAMLTDQFGTYDPLRWRAYAYEPLSGRNIEFSASTAAYFRPDPGRGFWLITRGSHRVDTRPIEGFSTPTGAEFPVPLAPGWNQFGNPFDFPVAWSSVRHSSRVGAPVAWNPGGGGTNGVGDWVTTPPAVLVPFEGYFVEDTAAVPETLWVSPLAATATALAAGASGHAMAGAEAAGDRWRLRLRASTAQSEDGANELGVNDSAAEGPDPWDLAKPPPAPGPWVSVAFTHEDWGPRHALYRRDLRAPDAEGETWEIQVRSGTPGEPVTLDLTDLVATTSAPLVRLVDREMGNTLESAPIGAASSGAVAPAGGAGASRLEYHLVSYGARPYRLAIVTGSASYIAHASEPSPAAPLRLALDPASPNPFRLATRVRFGLPRAGIVTAGVYSVQGQRVAALLDRAPLGPGYHSMLWDGSGARGGPVPSGVYLLRVAAGGEAVTRRLIVVR